MKVDTSLWMKVHLYLSLFFLPAALIYALTGALYIFDVRENADAKIQEFTLPSIPQQGEEQATILSVLHANNLKVPNDTQIRLQKGNATMGSIAYNVSITTNKQGQAIVRVTDRGLYGILVLMHKAKGKFYFDIIAVGFAISLMIFYLSGLIITSFCKKKRKEALLTFTLGLLLTALAIWASV